MKELKQLLNGFLPTTKIEEISNNYDKYKDYSLSQLGIDSFAAMGLILRIQDIYGITIDYEVFNINMINSLEKIGMFIAEQREDIG